MSGRMPTLDEIRAWPATVDPATGGRAFGISRSYAYELARRGDFPAKVLKVGGKLRVVTASILASLGAADEAAAPVRRRDTAPQSSRSDGRIGLASDQGSDGRFADAS